MKQPERVAELLAELRALTETDFERHRIDVLERDLTAPPTVEQVDETHQKFDGVNYRRTHKGHYTASRFIHRDVWQYYHGDIPEGDYDVHHIDQNPANNDISNLQLLTGKEHAELHAAQLRAPNKECPVCGKIFHPSDYTQRFCSRPCVMEFRKQKTEKICPVCGKKFFGHSKRVFCSNSCSAHFRSMNKAVIEKVCPQCGKTFTTQGDRNRATYCSRSCAAKASAHTRLSEKNVCVVAKSFVLRRLPKNIVRGRVLVRLASKNFSLIRRVHVAAKSSPLQAVCRFIARERVVGKKTTGNRKLDNQTASCSRESLGVIAEMSFDFQATDCLFEGQDAIHAFPHDER